MTPELSYIIGDARLQLSSVDFEFLSDVLKHLVKRKIIFALPKEGICLTPTS